ncbi:hypothetical protein ES708_27976 [subsurface metagenome]
MIVEGLFIFAPREPEKTGALVLKTAGEYFKMLVRLLKKLPVRFALGIMEAFRKALVEEE